MSLLTMIQGVAQDLGISSPTSVVGNPDTQVIQLLQMAQREGRDLASRYPWSKMVLSNTFTIAAAADQGLINSAIVTAGDFDYIFNETFWNDTDNQPITGPLSIQEWEALQVFPTTGPYPQFIIRSGHIYINPVPTVGTDTGRFTYKSTSWCESSGAVGRSAWAADTDVGRLDENLMSLGIIWRWLKRKGLDYGEDFKTYETRVTDAMARDGGKPILNSNGGRNRRIPGVMVPLGSWTP